MSRLSKTEALYNAILDNPMSSDSEKLKAAIALDAYRKQKGARQRFGKSRKLLGVRIRDSKAEASAKITKELPEYWQSTEFGRKTFPTWPVEKRREWVAVNQLEN